MLLKTAHIHTAFVSSLWTIQNDTKRAGITLIFSMCLVRISPGVLTVLNEVFMVFLALIRQIAAYDYIVSCVETARQTHFRGKQQLRNCWKRCFLCGSFRSCLRRTQAKAKDRWLCNAGKWNWKYKWHVLMTVTATDDRPVLSSERAPDSYKTAIVLQ
jgi:hypothetical protein